MIPEHKSTRRLSEAEILDSSRSLNFERILSGNVSIWPVALVGIEQDNCRSSLATLRDFIAAIEIYHAIVLLVVGGHSIPSLSSSEIFISGQQLTFSAISAAQW